MERYSSDYTEVPTDTDIKEVDRNDKNTWKPLFHQVTLQLAPRVTTEEEEVLKSVSNYNFGIRYQFTFLFQLIICSGIWGCYFVYGISMGAITVFVPQIRREENSTDIISSETVSWLVSSFGYTAIPWIFILPVLSDRFGRRLPFRLISIMAVIGSFVFYFSSSVVHILISEIFISVIAAAQVPVFVVIITEFSSPRYRGFFLTMKSASFNWGVWVANAIGTFFHWKNIGIIQIICSLYILISAIFWSESPFWLASNDRFEESRKAYLWLRGSSQKEKTELEHIVNTDQRRLGTNNTIRLKEKAVIFCTTIASKKIYKPLVLGIILHSFYYSTGKMVCTMYAIDIIKDISNSEMAAYTIMLILDGITVVSMYVGCALSKIISRRMLLFSTSFIGVTFLIIISLYLYLCNITVITENKYISTFLLMGFSIGISTGPMILCSSICSELLPLKYRNFVAFSIGLYDRIIMGTLLKISPFIFLSFGTYGAFLFFAVTSLCFLLLLYKYLPETKDKTLHEIEKLIVGTKMFENDANIGDSLYK